MSTQIAPGRILSLLILAAGVGTLTAALATIGVTLLDVVGVSAVLGLFVAAVALRRWSR